MLENCGDQSPQCDIEGQTLSRLVDNFREVSFRDLRVMSEGREVPARRRNKWLRRLTWPSADLSSSAPISESSNRKAARSLALNGRSH